MTETFWVTAYSAPAPSVQPALVAVRDEAARIDLNAASFELLQAFFEALGEPRAVATRLAAAVIDWRDADSLGQPAGGAEDADYAAAGLVAH